jgi:hypothetical protein
MKVIPKALATLTGQALACIEDPEVIQKILTHLQLNAEAAAPSPLPEPRAPPFSDLCDSF